MKQTDAQVKQAVLRELRWDTRVEETDVGVEVDAGVVTLTGTVSSWAKKVAAQEAAHRVAGVLDVANDVAVKIPGSAGRTDTEIAQAVRQVLEWNVFVPDKHVRTSVSDGWVTLEGDVDFWTQRDDAEMAVRNLAGVIAVSNKIEIKPPKGVSTEVQKAIEEALERQAEREAKRIKLDVHDGRVSVSGAARGTTGVRRVEDHLHIVV